MSIERFYSIINEIILKQGIRKLVDCSGRMKWPQRGVYFFFENGEYRNNLTDNRIVRVGTHAVSGGSRTTLWSRLRAHKGNQSGGGNHRGSIFRRHIGNSLKNKEGLDCPTWAIGRSADRFTRDHEDFLERKVSQIIGAMPFVWIAVDERPGTKIGRAYIERNAIALLSNYHKEVIYPASDNWLGKHSGHEKIIQSGLWNINHVNQDYDSDFMDKFECFVSTALR
jgi:hypothetical protein